MEQLCLLESAFPEKAKLLVIFYRTDLHSCFWAIAFVVGLLLATAAFAQCLQHTVVVEALPFKLHRPVKTMVLRPEGEIKVTQLHMLQATAVSHHLRGWRRHNVDIGLAE